MPDFPGVVFVQTLDESEGFRVDGAAPGDISGFAVSSAGDVNGDGIDDFLVGSRQASPDGRTNAGVTHVVFGNKNGFGTTLDLADLDGSNGFAINGVGGADFSGVGVSSAGDVNGDGLDDIIIGADAQGLYFESDSYVVFGSDSGFSAEVELSALDGSNGFRIDAGGPNVSGAGDINGDGFADIVTGNIRASPTDVFSGESYVILGTSDGFDASIDLATLDGTNGFRIAGVDQNDFSGTSVSSAGDMNGDGYDDVIIGAENAGPGGASYVVFGKPSGFAADLDLSTLDGTNGFRLDGVQEFGVSGSSVSSAGDVNGDGLDDLVIGDFIADANGYDNAGQSYVVFGKASGYSASFDLSSLDGTNGFAVNGVFFTDRFGFEVSGAGDVNGDGFDDIIFGAPLVDFVGYENAGEAYVLFGKASGFDASVTLFTPSGNNDLDGTEGFAINGAVRQLGHTVSDAGDINGDGFDDVIVGTNSSGVNGESYVIYGRAPTEAVTRVGGAADQTISGGDFNDTLSGLGGDDELNGGGGADRLLGDEGNDELNGDGGNDNLVGSVGDDTLNGGAGDDTLRGNAGFDTLEGGSGNDTLFGDFNADILRGGNDDDTLNGGAGGDRLFGDAGNDIINGDDGNDSLVGSLGNDTLDGGAGNDTMRGNAGFDVLSGGTGDDQMFGDFNADNLFGGDGNDVLNGGFGFDRLFGDDGDDTLNGDQGPDSLWGGSGNDTLNGGADNDTLRGNAGFDTLNGGAGEDTLSGDFNRDTLNGGEGSDQLFGGAGGDTFVFTDNAGSDMVNDWEDGTDVLDFSGVTSVTTIADLTIDAVSGTQTDISYDDGTGTVTLTVLSASPFSIDQSDVVI